MTAMNRSDDPIERLASAAERIAGALEYLVRASGANTPHAQLRVARSPTDQSPMAAADLDQVDKTLAVMVQNVGDADTTLEKPTVEIGGETVVGGVIGADRQLHPSGLLHASSSGPGVIVHFKLNGEVETLAKLPLTLRLRYTPGQFIGGSVHEMQMEPAGVSEGRPGWRQTEARDLPED